MQYKINMQDIKDYLGTVDERQPVGIPQHNHECLIGKALQQKYSVTNVRVGYDNKFAAVGDTVIATPADVKEVAEKFDDLWKEWGYLEEYEEDKDKFPPITLTTLRLEIPELFS